MQRADEAVFQAVRADGAQRPGSCCDEVAVSFSGDRRDALGEAVNFSGMRP